MNSEIKKLVDMALEDGVLTDKEREILLRKATSSGLDIDEFEMYLEGRLGQTNLNTNKEQELMDRSGSLNKIFKIERNRKEREQMENLLKDKEYDELDKIQNPKTPSAFDLMHWWENDLSKKDKNALGKVTNATTSFFGTYKPTKHELKKIYGKYIESIIQDEYEQKKDEIEQEREKREKLEKEQFEIETSEINSLRNTLTAVELKKLDKGKGFVGKLKSLFG